MSLEEHFTDKEFCARMKIDRATSLRWREQGIIKYLKLPNGQIRYTQAHLDEFNKRAEELAAVNNSKNAGEGSVVDISVAKRRADRSVAQNA